ncbi:MAG: bifunctional riboflavin kinase/FAD synthetase [Rickettsiales bacterium]
MKIYKSLSKVAKGSQDSILIIGNFDSVHKGHTYLIDEARKLADSKNKKLSLLTFSPHPYAILNPNASPINIFYEEQKIDKLKEKGVDALFILKFDEGFSSYSPEEFVENILVKALNIDSLIVGEDFRFGKKRSGNKDTLKKLSKKHGFGFSPVNIQSYCDLVYSSSSVRDLLSEGSIQEAAIILGYDYYIDGTIIPGKQNGRKIGFKTANIKPEGLFIPKKGVYASYATVEGYDKKFKSITNLGLRPTIDEQELVEVHLFDFDEDIYYKKLRVYLKKYIRPQIKFNNLQELKNQIGIDVQKAKEILEK